MTKTFSSLFIIAVVISLVSCSSGNPDGIQIKHKNSREIFISNINKDERVKAYRTAEKHCAKYFKVPRVLKNMPQNANSDSSTTTMNFECIKPSN